jgi:ADP-dependent phosphofructokinase/glucokinase
MGAFLTAVAAASAKLGRAFKEFVEKTASDFQAAKEKLRQYRLFAKTKATKNRMMKATASLVEKLNEHLGTALQAAAI